MTSSHQPQLSEERQDRTCTGRLASDCLLPIGGLVRLGFEPQVLHIIAPEQVGPVPL